MAAPTAEQQVAFLAQLQRLLAEGSFVATYKHALLLALADLSVERGDDSGDPLVLGAADAFFGEPAFEGWVDTPVTLEETTALRFWARCC